MFSPDGLCCEALVDHNGKCVTMQLAKLLKTSVAQIEKDIGSERVPAEGVAKVAMARGMPLYILHNGKKPKEYTPYTNYKQGAPGPHRRMIPCLCLWIREHTTIDFSHGARDQQVNRYDQTAPLAGV